jgi:hypothetical protein
VKGKVKGIGAQDAGANIIISETEKLYMRNLNPKP